MRIRLRHWLRGSPERRCASVKFIGRHYVRCSELDGHRWPIRHNALGVRWWGK
jgi:hypothetical protein